IPGSVGVAEAAFDVGDRVARQTGERGEVVLRQSAGLPQAAEVAAEAEPEARPAVPVLFLRHSSTVPTGMGELRPLQWAELRGGNRPEGLEIDVARTVETVAGIAETRDDVGVLVELRVHARRDQTHRKAGVRQRVDTR